jgi:hypothetical protein
MFFFRYPEEMTILRLMAKGKSGKEICDSIKAFDSEKIVCWHLQIKNRPPKQNRK